MKSIISIALVTLTLSGCVYKKTVTDSRGVVVEDKYIIKRPVKDFVDKVEFE